MMDFIPVWVDGAVVFNLDNRCSFQRNDCEKCINLIYCFHNYLKHAEMPYSIIDLQDEKYICPTILEELINLKKRMKVPFLFAGVSRKAQELLMAYNYHVSYPLFFTTEDAVKALRIQSPGITEYVPKLPILVGQSLIQNFDCEKMDQLVMASKKKQLLLSDW